MSFTEACQYMLDNPLFIIIGLVIISMIVFLFRQIAGFDERTAKEIERIKTEELIAIQKIAEETNRLKLEEQMRQQKQIEEIARLKMEAETAAKNKVLAWKNKVELNIEKLGKEYKIPTKKYGSKTLFGSAKASTDIDHYKSVKRIYGDLLILNDMILFDTPEKDLKIRYKNIVSCQMCRGKLVNGVETTTGLSIRIDSGKEHLFHLDDNLLEREYYETAEFMSLAINCLREHKNSTLWEPQT
jgi:hypothetical protein